MTSFYYDRAPEIIAEFAAAIASGDLVWEERIVEGIDNAPWAFANGSYPDRFEQCGGEWKIAQRPMVIDADTPANSTLNLSDYPKGARRADDPSHEWI